jgi:hypothetical protein
MAESQAYNLLDQVLNQAFALKEQQHDFDNAAWALP